MFECSSLLNAVPVANVFLSCTLLSIFFSSSSDVLRKHEGPSSITFYIKVPVLVFTFKSSAST